MKKIHVCLHQHMMENRKKFSFLPTVPSKILDKVSIFSHGIIKMPCDFFRFFSYDGVLGVSPNKMHLYYKMRILQ